MSSIKVINFLLTFFGLVISSQLSREPQGLFQPADHQILATVDAVLAALNINANFTKSTNIEHYLALHHFVKDTVKKNDNIYQNIWRKCKSTSSNKIGVYVSIIDKVIGEMISTQKVKVSTDLLNNNKSNYRDTIHNRLVIDFIKFAKGFNLSLNTLSPIDLLGVIPDEKWPQRKGAAADARRIFNGTDTRIARYPFMASLHVRGRFVCAGALVRTDQIITAASGLIPFISPQSDPRSIKARVGSDYTNKFGQLVPVAGFHFHPKFNWTTLRCNLAVIHLKKPLKLEGGKLVAIQYDTTAKQLPADVKKILILGWGEKRASPELGYKYNGSNQRLLLARLDLQDLEECKYIYTRTYVSNKHFCASSENNAGGACQFDVGGPAIVDHTLVGVASFGATRCGERHAPTVFTKLGFYADWIESIFKKNPPHNQQNNLKVKSVNVTDSGESSADKKWFYLKLIQTGLKSATLKELQDMLKKLEEEDATFKKTTKPDQHTHFSTEKAIFLDPKLVPTMPQFSEFIKNYEYKRIGSINPIFEGPTSTTTTEKSPLVSAGLTRIPQYPSLPLVSVATTTESAYGEYVFDMTKRSSAGASSPANTASNASTPSTTLAMPFTDMGQSFFYEQYLRKKFPNARKDKGHRRKKSEQIIQAIGSIPQYHVLDEKNLKDVLDWQHSKSRLQVSYKIRSTYLTETATDSLYLRL